MIGGLLDQLAGEGWVILHDRRKLPSSPANLDHLAVGPGGVFVIDAKNWTGGRVRLDDRGMAVGRWRRDDELHTVKVDADIVGLVATAVRPGLPTTGVVAFVQDMALSEPQQHRGVLVLQQQHLLEALRAAVPVLTATEITEVAGRLTADFPPRATSAAAASRQPAAGGRRPAHARPMVATSPTSPTSVRKRGATADQRRPTASQQRSATERERERRVAKRQLVKVTVMLACLPALPWAFEHVVPFVSQQVMAPLFASTQPER